MHRYTVLSQIGDGSFGIVRKAQHTVTGDIVAIKQMKQRFASWEECLQLREIQSLRRLQHPNIIKLREVIRENTELFMIFEFMDMNIYQISRMRSEQFGNVPGVFTEKEIRSIMCQTLLGLQAIHKGGFMHRDLKPENLLTKGDIVKIADFGLAKEIRSRPPFTDYVSTRWYRAPEIILRSTHYNSPIDIWACGVIFVELYMNRPLFPGASDPDQLFKICSVLGSPSAHEWDEGHQLARKLNIKFPPMIATPLKQIVPNASPAAIDLIEQMLRYNPQDRPTAAMCLQHPFFTGSGGSGGIPHDHFMSGGSGTSSSHGTTAGVSSLFQGIVTGATHNPFHMAAGVPSSIGQTHSSLAGGPPSHAAGGVYQSQQQQQQQGNNPFRMQVGGGGTPLNNNSPTPSMGANPNPNPAPQPHRYSGNAYGLAPASTGSSPGNVPPGQSVVGPHVTGGPYSMSYQQPTVQPSIGGGTWFSSNPSGFGRADPLANRQPQPAYPSSTGVVQQPQQPAPANYRSSSMYDDTQY